MNGPNPYEAPGPDVATSLERRLASRLLEARDRGGYTLGHFLWWGRKRLALRFLLFGLTLFCLVSSGFRDVFWVTLGLLIGATAQDFGWAIAQERTWPIQVKVTDWRTVERLAGVGETGEA